MDLLINPFSIFQYCHIMLHTIMGHVEQYIILKSFILERGMLA